MTIGNPHFTKKFAELWIVRRSLEILYSHWQLNRVSVTAAIHLDTEG